jgi:hypothetical protein
MRDVTQTPPAIKITQQQLECVKCGAETHAACNCGKPYMPKLQRAAQAVAANPEKSNRAIAGEIGTSEATVRRARAASDDAPDAVIGRDGRQYPATKPPTTKSPAAVEREIVNKLAHELVDIGYRAMTDRFQYDKPTMKRLGQARDELKACASGEIQF